MADLEALARAQQATANLTRNSVDYRLAASMWQDAGRPKYAVRCHRLADAIRKAKLVTP